MGAVRRTERTKNTEVQKRQRTPKMSSIPCCRPYSRGRTCKNNIGVKECGRGRFTVRLCRSETLTIVSSVGEEGLYIHHIIFYYRLLEGDKNILLTMAAIHSLPGLVAAPMAENPTIYHLVAELLLAMFAESTHYAPCSRKKKR